MKRREFIKNTTLTLSLCPLLSACTSKNDKFYLEDDQLPKHVRLDICTLCQLDCPQCFMRLQEEEIQKLNGFGYVSFDTFKKFVDKHPYVKEIGVSNHGEIFLNPDLDEIIKYSYEKGIKLNAYSGVNLNTISETTAEYLVKYQFGDMVVSIDGASPETYAIYRRGGDFNKVLDNIKMINKYKKLYNSDKPRLIYKFIPFGHNEHEIEKAKEVAASLDMDIMFDVNYAPGYSPLKNPEKVKEQTRISNIDNNFSNFYDAYQNGEEWFFCTDLFKNPQINFNGELQGCCMCVTEHFGVNVFEVGLEKALKSVNVQYAKKMLSDFSVVEKPEIPCTGCQIYEFLKKRNKTVS